MRANIFVIRSPRESTISGISKALDAAHEAVASVADRIEVARQAAAEEAARRRAVTTGLEAARAAVALHRFEEATARLSEVRGLDPETRRPPHWSSRWPSWSGPRRRRVNGPRDRQPLQMPGNGRSQSIRRSRVWFWRWSVRACISREECSRHQPATRHRRRRSLRIRLLQCLRETRQKAVRLVRGSPSLRPRLSGAGCDSGQDGGSRLDALGPRHDEAVDAWHHASEV